MKGNEIMRKRGLEYKWELDSKMSYGINIKKRMIPTIYGGIIGDMLGVPVEFRKRGTYKIEGVTGFGTYNQKPGTWSDDTSMTFCLMQNIIEKGNAEDLMNKFVDYAEKGYMTPYGKMFDIGRTTVESIRRFKKGIPANECGGNTEYDNGNGALMRIAPIAFTIFENFNFVEKCQVIKEISELTHRHPRSIVGSIIFVEILLRMYWNSTLKESLCDVKELFEENFSDNHIYRKELQNYSRIFDKDFFKTPEEEIKSSGYVVDTLEAAIWCLGTTDNFKDAVLKAVNLGGDTDTIASITGSLAGMLYKMDSIPEEWLEAIADKENVDRLIQEFFKYVSESAILKEYGSF